MNNKKNNEGQSDFSYYGLYLMDYLRTNKFEQATDTAFIRERADRAAETYEKARIEGYPTDGAQELAMETLLRGLHYSRYAMLHEVVENEFADEVPEEKQEAFINKMSLFCILLCNKCLINRKSRIGNGLETSETLWFALLFHCFK